MSIDQSKEVYLKQLASLPGGNIYHPGTYSPGELPEVLLNEAWVVQNPVAVAGQVIAPSSHLVQELEITTKMPTVLPKAYPVAPPVVVEAAAMKSAKLAVKTNINTANNDAISLLPLISPAVATIILKEREKGLFTDLANLSSRVVLPRGKWAELTDLIVF